MSLKINLYYDRKSDKIIGLEDYGLDNRTSKAATSVMVFMVQGIGGQAWKQPVCYYFAIFLAIRCAPKLSESHIKPHKLQSMKVRLATQVFSKTVLAGIHCIHQDLWMHLGPLP
ncbi:hypothetical protein FF38_10333 [Lucilia cuprina]|uniref:Transposable element P transposase-like RNase H domain-containing protein n=1 Tax=Lucilia cuprina TaxID=7375 RepID=A0A0L0C0T3_LUCCU|nr:hypothetical protein FF38_10333 [Lucilia cuprina]